MYPDLEHVYKHILGLASGALAHANWHAHIYNDFNKYWPQLSVIQAAHAGELFIKARIAQEHPLLLFEQLPRSTKVQEQYLELQHLFERGKTIQYSDLPERLWATTGLRVPGLERFHSFGRLRNTIQHFMAPETVDFSLETVRYIYEVIDPFINECWGLYAVDYNDDHEPYLYLIDALEQKNISFLMSPDARENIEYQKSNGQRMDNTQS